MKILIDNSGYDLLNAGDTAMLQMAVSRFEKLLPDAELHIYTLSPERLDKYFPKAIAVAKELTLDGRRVWKMRWNIFGWLYKFLPNSYLKNRLALFEFQLICSFPMWVQPWINWRLKSRGYDVASMNAALDLIRSADIVVATGGGYITDSFELHARRVLMTLALAHAFGKPTALLGQGLGPVNNRFLADIAKICLKKIDLITLREATEGLPLLRRYNVPEANIIVTGDDAIELAYTQRPEEFGRDIGINVRVSYYSGLDENIVGTIKPLILKIKGQYGAKVRSIPISSYKEESDAASVKRVFGEILDEDGESLVTPLEVITEVGHCRLVITGSYHAAVFALSQGISVIGLASSEYYQHKFQGLADQFSCGCYIVNMNDAKFANHFQSALEEAWLNAESLREKLLDAARTQIAMGIGAYGHFAKKCQNL